MKKLPYKELCEKRRILRESSKPFKPGVFVEIPTGTWPNTKQEILPTRALRSRDFLVQIFKLDGGFWRLSVNRAELDNDGNWRADITWQELQDIKAGCGFADMDAVEVFPAAADVVNVANMRHIWIIEDPSALPFIWRKNQS